MKFISWLLYLWNKPRPIVKNVKQCELCRGTVDRFSTYFQCRKCTAFGDLNTGIMTRLDREYYQERFEGTKNDSGQ